MRLLSFARSPLSSTLLRLTLATVPLASLACGASGEVGSSSDDVTSVENTSVKSQAIGNCWLYATAGWVESLHKGATTRDIDVSEAYWNYWFWYEQITGGDIDPSSGASITSIEAGGWWGAAAELIERYGWMYEGDFIPEADGKAKRHEEAIAAVNASLRSGRLSDPATRRDPRVVRAELNEAWRLTAGSADELARQFPVVPVKPTPPPAGAGQPPRLPEPPDTLVSITARAAAGSLGTTRIHAPQELQVVAADGTPSITLADAIGTREPGTDLADGQRVGDEAWSEVSYDWADVDLARRGALLKNVQNALNHRLAVPLAWAVAGEPAAGVYRGATGNDIAVAGLHESILVDYEVENVPGFGTLSVDVRETRPDALEATLDDAARITFFRLKNSWGTDPVWTDEELRQSGLASSADRGPAAKPNYLPSRPGFNDLTIAYFDTKNAATGDPTGGRLALRLALPKKLRFPVPPASYAGSPASGAGTGARK